MTTLDGLETAFTQSSRSGKGRQLALTVLWAYEMKPCFLSDCLGPQL